jgi:hypothetical protein
MCGTPHLVGGVFAVLIPRSSYGPELRGTNGPSGCSIPSGINA